MMDLQHFAALWEVRLYNSHFIPAVKEAYNMMYPKTQTYKAADKAKQEVDRFLNRVSSLKALL